MSKIALFNIGFGFAIVAIAAAGGAFISFDIATAFLSDPEIIKAWDHYLQRSAHGHLNLFGLLHVLLGLSLPYSKLPASIKKWQTVGFLAGSLAMGPGLLIRGYLGPSAALDLNGIIIGGLLTLALIAVASHSFAILRRVGSLP